MTTRILYLITDPISTRLLRGQLRTLVEAGFEVHLACGAGPQPEEFSRSEGVTVHEIPFVREPSLARDLQALVHTVRLLRRLRPDIVNSSTPKAGLLGTVAAFLTRVPVRVYVVRGLRFEGTTGIGRRVLRTMEQLAALCATNVVFNSPSLLLVARTEHVVGSKKALVLRNGSGNGLDPAILGRQLERSAARSALGLPDRALVVGFVGRLTRDKGVVDLVSAFDRIIATVGDARLLVIGSFEPGDPVPAATRSRMEADERIVMAGWRDDALTLYSAMDVLAFPSYREGLPNVPIEAQAAGVPVVAYAATGTVDALQQGTGALIPIGDISSLAEEVARLLDDSSLRLERGRNAQHWVKATFDQQALWDELIKRYREWAR